MIDLIDGRKADETLIQARTARKALIQLLVASGAIEFKLQGEDITALMTEKQKTDLMEVRVVKK